jgi:hypothetical protein
VVGIPLEDVGRIVREDGVDLQLPEEVDERTAEFRERCFLHPMDAQIQVDDLLHPENLRGSADVLRVPRDRLMDGEIVGVDLIVRRPNQVPRITLANQLGDGATAEDGEIITVRCNDRDDFPSVRRSIFRPFDYHFSRFSEQIETQTLQSSVTIQSAPCQKRV